MQLIMGRCEKHGLSSSGDVWVLSVTNDALNPRHQRQLTQTAAIPFISTATNIHPTSHTQQANKTESQLPSGPSTIYSGQPYASISSAVPLISYGHVLYDEKRTFGIYSIQPDWYAIRELHPFTRCNFRKRRWISNVDNIGNAFNLPSSYICFCVFKKKLNLSKSEGCGSIRSEELTKNCSILLHIIHGP